MLFYFKALKEKTDIGLLTHFDTRKNTRKALGLAWIWLDSGNCPESLKSKNAKAFCTLAFFVIPKFGVPGGFEPLSTA